MWLFASNAATCFLGLLEPVADGLAAFQLEVTQRRKLLLTVLREGGKMKYKRQQKQSEKFHGRELYAMTVARQQ